MMMMMMTTTPGTVRCKDDSVVKAYHHISYGKCIGLSLKERRFAKFLLIQNY